MAALVQLGEVFTVKQPSGKRGGKQRISSRKWAVFQCSCGAKFPSPLKPVNNGRTKSCGCYSRTKFVKAAAEYNASGGGGATTHGQCSTGAYTSWNNMLQRCTNPRNSAYYMYGAVGITVCGEWSVFENFYTDMGPRPDGTSLDRIDSKGDYCKENCKWSTPREQANNTSRNKYLTIDGETKTYAEWGRVVGLQSRKISHRIRRGWSPEEAVYGRNK